jgi:acetolactate synthase-1/2/3 large subunit
MKVKVSDYIAKFMVENSITDLFTVTGGGAMHLNDSLGNHPKLHSIYNHHEQACAIAAEAYARLTGKIALVCVTSGPGGTNAITGVMGGWVDSIPMFVVSGQVKFSTTIASTNVPLRQLGDQEFNIIDAVKCMTKYAVMVTEPDSIAYHLERALFLASHGRPGPVWLDIPLNVQGAIIETDSLVHYDQAEDATEIVTPPANDVYVQLIEKIKGARKPVILAGSGIRLSRTYDTFLELLDHLRIPVVTAWNAHDALWDAHPLYCGRPGTIGTRGGNFVVQNSDLLISLGCRMNIRQISYNWENFAKNAYLVAVDIDEGELRKPTLTVDMPIHADLADFLPGLLDAVKQDSKLGNAQWLAWCRDVNQKYPAVLPEYSERDTPINPYVFMERLSRHLEEGDVTITGNGSACVCSFQAMAIKKNQRLFTNSGCASMGYGLPAALGGAVALQGKRVICLDGDGSIQMNLQELQTIVHNQLNMKIFWLNNDGYHSIRQTQSNIFNSRFCGVNGASGISFPSAGKIAHAYGIEFVRIDALATLDDGIAKVLASNNPVICEVILDPAQGFAPKLSARILPDGSMVSPSLEDMFPFLSEEEMRSNIFS